MKWMAVFLAAGLCLLPATLVGDDQHHDQALSSEELGTVNFPESCAPATQATFNRGVALLHSFEYDDARKAFQEVEKADSRCAIAQWGIAMSLYHELWGQPHDKALKEGESALKRAQSSPAATPREREYIAALNVFYSDWSKREHETRAAEYSQAMEKLYQHYPEDREAAAFYALSLLGSEPAHDTTFANRKKAAAILQKLFDQEPNHPGLAHYLIHTCDRPQLATLGLNAARRYAKIAPSSPHALHMPSHIFARLGLWQDDIDSNLASIAATRQMSAMHMRDAGHQFHAMDFLVYAYLQSGHEKDVERQIAELAQLKGVDEDGLAYSQAKFPALLALELRRWPDAAALKPVKEAHRSVNAFVYFARAIGEARSGNAGAARKDAREIESIHKDLVAANKKYEADDAEILRQEASAWAMHADKKDDEAIRLLRAAADQEDAEGPEQTSIPAREMLADLLLEINRPQEAMKEYQVSLAANPNRFNGLYGAARAAEKIGKTDDAAKYYAELVTVCAGSGSDRPELTRAKQLLAQK
jgi:tetratricopeptide (TPR) repeat protein